MYFHARWMELSGVNCHKVPDKRLGSITRLNTKNLTRLICYIQLGWCVYHMSNIWRVQLYASDVDQCWQKGFILSISVPTVVVLEHDTPVGVENNISWSVALLDRLSKLGRAILQHQHSNARNSTSHSNPIIIRRFNFLLVLPWWFPNTFLPWSNVPIVLLYTSRYVRF